MTVMKVGDLIKATCGTIKGITGVVTEIDSFDQPGHFNGAVTVSVLWAHGEYQEWINPKYLEAISESR